MKKIIFVSFFAAIAFEMKAQTTITGKDGKTYVGVAVDSNYAKNRALNSSRRIARAKQDLLLAQNDSNVWYPYCKAHKYNPSYKKTKP